MKKMTFAVLVALALLPAHALLDESASHAQEGGRAAQAQEPASSSAPPALVQAISRQESGLNPMAVNVAGVSHYPASIEEAEAIITAAQRAGKSFDVGTMQINSWWIQKFGIPIRELLDPVTNTRWGSWILSQEIARLGLTWIAVGKYHSPDMERGRRYAWHVYRHYAPQSASPSPASQTQEPKHAVKAPSREKLPDAGGVQRNSGVRRQGRFVSFDLPEKGESRPAGKKP